MPLIDTPVTRLNVCPNCSLGFRGNHKPYRCISCQVKTHRKCIPSPFANQQPGQGKELEFTCYECRFPHSQTPPISDDVSGVDPAEAGHAVLINTESGGFSTHATDAESAQTQPPAPEPTHCPTCGCVSIPRSVDAPHVCPTQTDPPLVVDSSDALTTSRQPLRKPSKSDDPGSGINISTHLLHRKHRPGNTPPETDPTAQVTERPRRNEAIIGTGPTISGITVAAPRPKRSLIFVSRAGAKTTATAILDHCKKISPEVLQVRKFRPTTSSNDAPVSFLVTVKPEAFTDFLKAENWPPGLLIKAFRHKGEVDDGRFTDFAPNEEVHSKTD